MIGGMAINPLSLVEVSRATASANAALQELSGGRVSIRMPSLVQAQPADVLMDIGSSEREMVGVYVGFGGGMDGHALLLMTPDGASRVASHLLAGLGVESVGANDAAMARSGLEELGNVVISAVLNELGRPTPVPVHPTVPQVVSDMAGAILDGVLADLVIDCDEITLARSVFAEGGDTFDGWLLILPRSGDPEATADGPSMWH